MRQMIKGIGEVAIKLSEIASEGYDVKEVARIWTELPTGEEEVSDLEAAGQCILEISNLVDQRFPKLSKDLRTAKKYRLMANLLSLRAEQLEKFFIAG